MTADASCVFLCVSKFISVTKCHPRDVNFKRDEQRKLKQVHLPRKFWQLVRKNVNVY